MGDIVSLNKARKLAGRRSKQKLAATNRVAHGPSKAERALEQARRDKAAHEIDQHCLKPDGKP